MMTLDALLAHGSIVDIGIADGARCTNEVRAWSHAGYGSIAAEGFINTPLSAPLPELRSEVHPLDIIRASGGSVVHRQRKQSWAAGQPRQEPLLHRT